MSDCLRARQWTSRKQEYAANLDRLQPSDSWRGVTASAGATPGLQQAEPFSEPDEPVADRRANTVQLVTRAAMPYASPPL